MAPDRELDRITALLVRTSGPSSLYQWLRRRHDAFAEHLGSVRPNWSALAAEFGALGLTDSAGQAASAERVRKIWWRVRRDVARAGERMAPGKAEEQTQPPEIMPTASTAPPALPGLAVENSDGAWADEPFKPARLKGRQAKSTTEGGVA